jgi:hypothetical protein
VCPRRREGPKEQRQHEEKAQHLIHGILTQSVLSRREVPRIARLS